MHKFLQIIFLRIIPAILLFVIGALTAFYYGRTATQDHFAAMQKRVGEDVVNIAEHVDIGGIPQWITMRGQDKDNPVLLYLHGGPGAVSSGYSYSYQYPWEDVFTVVHWDQRGSGRSYPAEDMPLEVMTMDQMLSDTIEVVDHLRKRFGQEKIFVIGKSWGSQLGALLAKKRPDMLHAYISIGQTISFKENMEETRRLLIEHAKGIDDQETIDLLTSAGNMPDASDTEAFNNWLATLQSPLYRFGKYWHAQSNPGDIPLRMVGTALMSPNMTFGDISNFTSDDKARYVIALMATEDYLNYDLNEIGYDFDVPMIMAIGAHDWTTPVTLAREYFAKVKAPYKKYIEFEHSAHMLGLYEESGLFFKMLVEDALPLAQKTLTPYEQCLQDSMAQAIAWEIIEQKCRDQVSDVTDPLLDLQPIE